MLIGRAGDRCGQFAVRSAGGCIALAGIGIPTGLI